MSDSAAAMPWWRGYLVEGLSLRSSKSFVEELEKRASFISENCSGMEDGKCYWLEYVAHTCKRGLEKAGLISCST